MWLRAPCRSRIALGEVAAGQAAEVRFERLGDVTLDGSTTLVAVPIDTPSSPATTRSSSSLLSPGDTADEDVFEVLSGPPPRASVHMARDPIFEHKARSIENLRVQVLRVVDDDENRRFR